MVFGNVVYVKGESGIVMGYLVLVDGYWLIVIGVFDLWVVGNDGVLNGVNYNLVM